MASSVPIDERLAEVPLFAACSKKEIAQISRLMTTVPVGAGHVLTEQGHLGHEFVVILEGEASVTRDGHEVRRLGPGDHFGEIALLDDDHLRTATVVAETDMEIEVLDRREFTRLVEEHPSICRRLLVGLARIVAGQHDG